MRSVMAVLVIAAGIAVAIFLVEHPGSVSLVWQGWRVETSVAVLAIVTGILLLLGWVLLRAIGAVVGLPGRVGARRRQGAVLLGYRAISDGLVALAAGDARDAERLRLKAEAHFRTGRHAPPPLTRLLTAQAALLRDDHAAAGREFQAMLESPETEFLGLRGLIVQSLKAGDDAAALALTERAGRLRPNTPWVLRSRLALETRSGAWGQAQATLADAVKRKAVAAAEGRHHRVALLVAQSIDAEAAGDTRAALKSALKAHALDPGFEPAAGRAARLLTDIQRTGRAATLLERAWVQAPHPALATSYDRLFGDMPAGDRLKKMERLIGLRESVPAGHLAAAGLALEGRLWGEARRHLEAAGASTDGPWPQRVCRLMVELEEREAVDPAAARRWLERLPHGSPDPQWVCGVCHAATPAWAPICPDCQSFDSLNWSTPTRAPGAHGALPAARPAALLPGLERGLLGQDGGALVPPVAGLGLGYGGVQGAANRTADG